MERNDIENINSNQSNQCSYGGAKRSDRGGSHGGGAGLHPSLLMRYVSPVNNFTLKARSNAECTGLK